MKFFKNGYDGGIGNFLLEMGGSQERWGGRGVGFKIGGWEIFKVSLHSWQRSANPPIL